MELRLKRTALTDTYTLGEMFIDNEFFCYTVEDKVRDANKDGDHDDIGETKVYGETAIPYGTYKVILSMSNRFKKLMPEVLNVKGFTGVRIHAGNNALDSHGCIILGSNRTNNGVANSRQSFLKLMAKLDGVLDIKLIIE